MSRGIDTACVLTAHTAAAIAAEGCKFVGRYLCRPGNDKLLKRNEAQIITDAGLSIVSVWEQGYPIRASYFTSKRGALDAEQAIAAAQAAGQPQHSPVYFAVDYDAVPCDMFRYFKAVELGMAGSGYSIGVYGSGAVCLNLREHGLVDYTWLAQSRGWAGYATLPTPNIRQSSEFTLAGLDVDGDITNGHGGGWRIIDG